MKEVKAYQCEYCGRKYHSKGRCKEHEKICWMNADNKLCGSCEYFLNLGSWCRKCKFKQQYTDASETCENYTSIKIEEE